LELYFFVDHSSISPLYAYSHDNWLYLAPSGIRGDAVVEGRGLF